LEERYGKLDIFGRVVVGGGDAGTKLPFFFGAEKTGVVDTPDKGRPQKASLGKSRGAGWASPAVRPGKKSGPRAGALGNANRGGKKGFGGKKHPPRPSSQKGKNNGGLRHPPTTIYGAGGGFWAKPPNREGGGGGTGGRGLWGGAFRPWERRTPKTKGHPPGGGKKFHLRASQVIREKIGVIKGQRGPWGLRGTAPVPFTWACQLWKTNPILDLHRGQKFFVSQFFPSCLWSGKPFIGKRRFGKGFSVAHRLARGRKALYEGAFQPWALTQGAGLDHI